MLTRIAKNLRHQTRVGAAILAIVAVAGALTGCADPSTATRTGASATPKATDQPLLSSDQVTSLAMRVAADNSDPAPTSIEWVATTSAAAHKLADGGDIVNNVSDGPVFLVQIKGQFTHHGRSGYKAPDPTGTFITLIVNATTGLAADFGLTDVSIDLSTLGPVSRAP